MTAAIHPKGSPFEQEKLFFDICEAAQEEPLQGDILRGFKKMSDTEEFQAVFGSENFEDKDRIANAFFALHKNVTAFCSDYRGKWKLEQVRKVIEKTALLKRFFCASLQELEQDFQSRTWAKDLSFVFGQRTASAGYESPDREADRERLLILIQEHNDKFCSQTPPGGDGSLGFAERLDLKAGDETYVRADLHGDLACLLSQLKVLREAGYLDKDFRCRPAFYMIFLGDYMDRGPNDLEVLTLLLALHIKNPNSVFLLRGNHEDRAIYLNTLKYKGLDSHFLKISALYGSFPVALCAGVRRSSQYVHFSHGLFSAWSRLDVLFTKEAASRMPIQKPEEPIVDLETVSEEKRPFFARVNELIKMDKTTYGYTYGDVGTTTGPCARGGGILQLSAADVYAYGQVAAGSTATLELFIRGHQHELTVLSLGGSDAEKRAIVITMPTGTAGGFFGEGTSFPFQPLQGLLLRAQERIQDWEKRNVLMRGRGNGVESWIQGQPHNIFEPNLPFSS